MTEPVLEVRNLRVDAPALDVNIVDDVSFAVPRGATVALVGESASGKSSVAMALLGHTQRGLRLSGSVLLGGDDLASLDEQALRRVRGRHIAFVAQDPSTSLNPTMRVGDQVAALIRTHMGSDHVEDGVERAFERAQLHGDPGLLRRYPHELSGGQQQRVAIAAALSCEPDVIVMDEPTTALDVTTQARLLEVIAGVCHGDQRAVVYVSHDLAVVRHLADYVAVMYAGRFVEDGPVERIFRSPAHPYTRRLLEAVPPGGDAPWQPVGIPGAAAQPGRRPTGCTFAPRCRHRAAQCLEPPPRESLGPQGHVRCVRHGELGLLETSPPAVGRGACRQAVADGPAVIELRGLKANYVSGRRGRSQPAVVEISQLSLSPGSCLAVVGESGSGKSTLLRCLAGLLPPYAGELTLDGRRVPWLPRRRSLEDRRALQLIPQNPYSSLNPRRDAAEIVVRPLKLFHNLGGAAARARVDELLEAVGLAANVGNKRPGELSGGERQRVAIARALAAEPQVLLCDEITSALDVAVQAAVLNLLARLGTERQLGIVFVSHDLATVRGICDRVVVLERGRVCEDRPAAELFGEPEAPYTQELLSAVPALVEGDWPLQSALRMTASSPADRA